MNNSVFRKAMENVRKYRDFNIVATKKRGNYLVSESIYNTTVFISEKMLSIMEIVDLLINKPLCSGLSILGISKIAMYEFCYDYMKPKQREKAKLCYMDADSFIVHIKTEDIYTDLARDVETWFDNSNYELDRLLPRRKTKR